ncbi:YpmS family protein, partial [Bacillaceae bacterium Marseille-Q3522]|nr:YpmS family protein [Bacillaceae bacterium Marseille-Q3522]
YLQEYKTRKMNYHIWLGKDVELYGTFPFFSQNIDMKMTFEPLALENGDLLLKQKSISIGQLSLPVANVMKIISRQYKIPEWVTIQPKEEQVYVSLQNMNLAGDLKVKLNEFNLIEDNIQFTFQVPSD